MQHQLPIDLPPTEDELKGKTTCGKVGCEKMFFLKDAIIGCIAIGTRTEQEHFCSRACREVWRSGQPSYARNIDREQIRALGTTAY